MNRLLIFMLAMCMTLPMMSQGRIVRVSCVGASISEGYGTTQPWSENSYPGRLGRLLGPGYHVENFGRGGCTMLRQGDCPYWEKERFVPSLQSRPDIVFVDLGGNDAKLRNRIHKADFVRDACDLVRRYQQLPSRPRVILMTAIPGFTTDSTEIWDKAIVRDINPLIVEAGRKMNVEVLDMHVLFVGRSDLFPDGVHPNDEGAQMMACKMAEFLTGKAQAMEPVDYVNPYIGNVSHLLVPTFPTIQLPNSMLRVYPDRADYTSEYIGGLPVVVTNHRERSAFKIIPQQDSLLHTNVEYTYDNEHIKPYSFCVNFNDGQMSARYGVCHQSAIYEIRFGENANKNIVVTTANGSLSYGDNWVSGWQTVDGQTKVYVYLESGQKPIQARAINDKAVAFSYSQSQVSLRYGVSFISETQAKKNLYREQSGYDLSAVISAGRKAWNDVLGRIAVAGGSDEERRVFYSSYYRTFERPVCLSEDGHYWSGDDNKVHEDGGVPYYTDDWIWDTYRAAHPLRLLTDATLEEHVLASYLRMADNNGKGWIPTFPEVNGDSRRMNSNHTVATFADALAMGLHFNLKKAFDDCRRCMEEKSLAPWSGNSKGAYINAFYKLHGYIPALRPEEKEIDPSVNPHERRQPVAVTLGTAYDEWCLSKLAAALARTTTNHRLAASYAQLATNYRMQGLNYRHLYNPSTAFFHPKDSAGLFIEPFDYSFSGGMGAREYYGENNGWVYRWDVPHNISDLVRLMGGKEKFVANLDQTFAAPLGRSKYEFFAMLPDHTGLVGQYSMANEPSLHIPYLYSYAGKPWKTQKRIRQLLATFFRNDVEGIPGDEDGGGMTSFVVLSMLGFYHVTPGTDVFVIGSPVFSEAKMRLSNGNTFEIRANDASQDNKYIQHATLNGKEWNKSWFRWSDIKDGAVLELQMGALPNKAWGALDVPPSTF